MWASCGRNCMSNNNRTNGAALTPGDAGPLNGASKGEPAPQSGPVTTESVTATLRSLLAAPAQEQVVDERDGGTEEGAGDGNAGQVSGSAEESVTEAPAGEEAGQEPGEGERGEAESADEESEAEEGEGEGEQPVPLPDGVRKRLAKLTGQKKELRAELDRLKAELEELRGRAEPGPDAEAAPEAAPAPSVVRASGLDHVAADRIDAYEAEAESIKADLDDYVDGAADEATSRRVQKFLESVGVPADADGAALKRVRRQVERHLTREIPARRQFLAEEAKYDPLIRKLVPWVADRRDPRYAQAQQVLSVVPELRGRSPAWRLAAAAYVLGMEQIRALQQDAAKPAKKASVTPPPNAKPPPKSPGAPAAKAPVRPAGSAAKLAAAADEMRRTNSPEAVARYARQALAQAV